MRRTHRHDWEFADGRLGEYHRDDCNGCGDMRIIHVDGTVSYHTSSGLIKSTKKATPRLIRRINWR